MEAIGGKEIEVKKPQPPDTEAYGSEITLEPKGVVKCEIKGKTGSSKKESNEVSQEEALGDFLQGTVYSPQAHIEGYRHQIEVLDIMMRVDNLRRVSLAA